VQNRPLCGTPGHQKEQRPEGGCARHCVDSHHFTIDGNRGELLREPSQIPGELWISIGFAGPLAAQPSARRGASRDLYSTRLYGGRSGGTPHQEATEIVHGGKGVVVRLVAYGSEINFPELREHWLGWISSPWCNAPELGMALCVA
jgi:hypothetical protein